MCSQPVYIAFIMSSTKYYFIYQWFWMSMITKHGSLPLKLEDMLATIKSRKYKASINVANQDNTIR